ncbi:hypothetical protein FHW96_002159 [Novosphingobium sp. SG751A]|nr:hypothetical protein [Novosphingobium sp. SG751A]
MLGHEGRNKVIGMVIARLHADRRWLPGGLAGCDEQVGLELSIEEIVGLALIDEQVGQVAW